MMDNKKAYKQKQLKEKLPIHQAPNDVWTGIEKRLDQREDEKNDFDGLKQKLPLHTPGEEVWNKIESELEAKKHKSVSFFTKSVWKIAASFLIFASLSIAIIKITHKPSGKEYITYNTEMALPAVDRNSFFSAGQDLSKQIGMVCKQRPMLCESDVYKALENELDNLEMEGSKIRQAYEETRSEQLLDYLNFVDKQKIEIQKKMLQYSTKI